jgi:hypothetical protein
VKQLLDALMNDQTFFVRFVRGTVAAAAVYLQATGKITPEVAAIMTGGALFAGAGELNQPQK